MKHRLATVQTSAPAAKVCSQCSRHLSLSMFYRRGAGHHSYCKLCHWDRTRELRDEKALRARVEGTPAPAALESFAAFLLERMQARQAEERPQLKVVENT